MQRPEGFYDRSRFRPGGFILVVGLHAAALTALALVRTPEFVERISRTIIYDVKPLLEPEPEPKRQPERAEPRPAERPSNPDAPETMLDLPLPGPSTTNNPVAPLPPVGQSGAGELLPQPRAEPAPLPEPVRAEAQVDPRYADQLQPEYPASEQRAGRAGTVRVRVTIGTDGRVKAVGRLSATSDAFWRATERHARSRWRFRPATIDGRPVESEKVMNVYFQLQD